MIAPADSASVPLLLAAGKADLAISYQPQLYAGGQAGAGDPGWHAN